MILTESESLWTLLRSAAHWEFELILMLVFDGLIIGICWPFAIKHWRHHIDRDRQDQRQWAAKVGKTTEDKSHVWTTTGLFVADDIVNDMQDGPARPTIQDPQPTWTYSEAPNPPVSNPATAGMHIATGRVCKDCEKPATYVALSTEMTGSANTHEGSYIWNRFCDAHGPLPYVHAKSKRRTSKKPKKTLTNP